MENSANAILIAAGVLIGLMVLSVAISLYSSLRGYVEGTQDDINNAVLQEFNEQFLKYIGDEYTVVVLTIQDVVTAANLAYENNQQYGLEEYNPSNNYITIKLSGHGNPEYDDTNLEKNINGKSTKLLDNGVKNKYTYKCEEVKINPNTGRVSEVRFKKINNEGV